MVMDTMCGERCIGASEVNRHNNGGEEVLTMPSMALAPVFVVLAGKAAIEFPSR